MLVSILRYIKGSVRFTATGNSPERLLNLAAARGVPLWNPQPVEGGIAAGLDPVEAGRLFLREPEALVQGPAEGGKGPAGGQDPPGGLLRDHQGLGREGHGICLHGSLQDPDRFFLQKDARFRQKGVRGPDQPEAAVGRVGMARIEG